jgi:uncharacterized protein involved in outer membrane biogenesis
MSNACICFCKCLKNNHAYATLGLLLLFLIVAILCSETENNLNKQKSMVMNSVAPLNRKLIWAAGIIVAVVFVFHILLPLVANTPEMRTRILSQMDDRFSGDVDFRKIRPALLPWPHAIVTQGRFSQTEKFSIRFSEAIVYPQFWPLLLGRVKLGNLKVVNPDVVVFLPSRSSPTREKPGDNFFQSLGRQARDTLVASARELGFPTARIEDGRLTLVRSGQSSIEFSKINLETKVVGEQLTLHIAGRSNMVRAFEFAGRIDLPTLDGTGHMDLSGLDTASLASLELIPTAASIPVMVIDMETHFQSRGLETFHCGFQVKAPDAVVNNGSRQLTVRELLMKGDAEWTTRHIQITLSRLQTSSPAIQLQGTAAWSLTERPAKIPTELLLKGINLDVDQIRTAALQLAGNQPVMQRIFDIVRGGRMPELTISIKAPDGGHEQMTTRIGFQGRLTDGRIVVRHDLLLLDAVKGQVSLEKGRLSAEHVGARLGNSVSQNGTLQLGLMDGTRAFSLDTEIDADMSELAATLKRLADSQKAADLLDQLPPISGHAIGRLWLGDSLERITARIDANGYIDALDAAVNISGKFDGLPSAQTTMQLDLSGPMGPRTVEWLGRWGAVPAELLPKAPIKVNRTQINRDPTGVLGLDGEFSFPAGLHLAAAFKISQDELEVSKFHLKDATSDALIKVNRSKDGSNWKVGFKGYLDKSATDKLLQQNNLIQGWIKGDLQADFQADAPARAEIHGRLTSRNLTIPLGSRPPLSILDASLEGKGRRFDLKSAELKWQENTARLSGSGTFAPEALDLDLKLNADTLDADKMMPDKKAENPADRVQLRKKSYTLPVRGKLRVEAGQLILGGYRFAPLQTVVTMQAGKITVDVTAADLCGIAMPGKIRFDQDGLQMAFKPYAARSPLRDTDRCLAGTSITERLEGTVSANGIIATHGRDRSELTRNLAGQLDIQILDGRVYNAGAAGLFTNLLAFISVNQLIEGELPDLRKNDFLYKSLTSKLALKDGSLRIEEGVLKSNAVNIVGHGDYGLASGKLDLVLLVSPLTTVDWVIERLPLIGNILQGTLVAIPVGVKGPAVNPAVVPLSPAAVGSRVGGILERTINTPFRILSPLLKDRPKS